MHGVSACPGATVTAANNDATLLAAQTRRLLEEARADNVSLYEKVGGGGVGWGGRVEADNVPLYEKEVS